MRCKNDLRPAILPLSVLAVWLIASSAGLTNAYLLPSPGRIAEAAGELLADGELIRHIAASLWRVLFGFALTALIALPLAFLTGIFAPLGGYLGWVLEALRVTPPLALVPLLILWLGIGEASKLTIVVLASFFPVYMNALVGIREADGKLSELARTLDLSRRETALHVLLPAALPGIVNGLRLGFGYSWRALVGAELIAASSGIGYMILDAQQLSRPDLVIIGILTIGVMGTLIDLIFFALTQRLIPWKVGESTDYGRG